MIIYEAQYAQVIFRIIKQIVVKNKNTEWFYGDYVDTYLEKDIKQIIRIKDVVAFRISLVNNLARTAQEIVYKEITNNIGKDVKTIKEWLSIISQTGLVKLFYPYQNNVLKQMVKLPKLYIEKQK